MRNHLFFFTLLLVLYAGNANSAAPVLLFDQGHGQAFTIEKEGPLQLGGLAEIFRGAGWQVTSTSEMLSEKALAQVDALIISGAFRTLSDSELAAVDTFLRRGGRLAVLLHIAPPMWSLLDQLRVEVGAGVLRETQGFLGDEPLNFAVTDLASHPLTEGLAQFSLYGGWPLMPMDNQVRLVARSSQKSWVDLDRDGRLTQNDAVGSFGIIAEGRIGEGSFLVFGDDAIFQNRYLDKANRRLADNLSRWLKGDSAQGTQI